MVDTIRELEQEFLKDDIPNFGPGDNVRVHYPDVETIDLPT